MRQDGTRTPGSRAEQRLVWRRLRAALRLQARPEQVIVGLLCALLGLSIVLQVRQHDESGLEGASQQELVRLLGESDRHVDDLENENADLDRTLGTLQDGRADDDAAQEAANRRLAELGILSGVDPAAGRGLVLTLTDPTGGLRAPTVLGLIQELRNAGAEVIEVGGVRVVASTAVTATPSGGIAVDGTEIRTPVTVRAIGDPAVMEPALRIPGGAADAVAADGGTLSARAEDEVRIDAVVDLPVAEHTEVVK